MKKPKDYDYLNDSLCEYHEKFNKFKLDESKNVLHLDYFGYNPISNCQDLFDFDINELLNASIYNCPFNGYKHYSILPISIVTNDPRSYIIKKLGHDKVWYADMACDLSWNQDQDKYHLTSIAKILMGPGYTNLFYPSDGGNLLDYVSIDLSNGDELICVIWKWYNK